MKWLVLLVTLVLLVWLAQASPAEEVVALPFVLAFTSLLLISAIDPGLKLTRQILAIPKSNDVAVRRIVGSTREESPEPIPYPLHWSMVAGLWLAVAVISFAFWLAVGYTIVGYHNPTAPLAFTAGLTAAVVTVLKTLCYTWAVSYTLAFLGIVGGQVVNAAKRRFGREVM